MRTWFITGISRGLGLAMARQALSQGDRVVGTVRSGQVAMDAGPSQLKILTVDLSDPLAVTEMVHQAFAAFGQIDVVVNNAGSGLFGPVENTTDAELRQLFEIDVFAPIAIIRTALPYLRRQGHGHIINITSIAGRAPGTGAALYAAAKAALEGLSAALSQEIGPLGIKVTAVAPGQFRTRFMSSSTVHKSDPADADYSATVGASLGALAKTYENQLGDPAKAAEAIAAIVGSAEPPLHLLLGSDALERAQRKITATKLEIDAWRHLSLSTDHS